MIPAVTLELRHRLAELGLEFTPAEAFAFTRSGHLSLLPRSPLSVAVPVHLYCDPEAKDHLTGESPQVLVAALEAGVLTNSPLALSARVPVLLFFDPVVARRFQLPPV